MVDLYFSYRSPYSYLILPRMIKLKNESNVGINFKIVYPLAIRMPEWFEKKNIFFFIPFIFDFKKKAKKLNMPINLPLKPDPIRQNSITGKISQHQPYIFDVTHMGQEMSNRGFGLEFAYELSKKIWSEKNWNTDESISEALKIFNVDFNEIKESIKNNEGELIKQIKQNQVEQLKAGHHGVPLSVHKDKYFFGQDRFDDLVSSLKKNGDL